MGRQAALRGSTAHPPPASPGLHLHTHSSHSGVCLVPGRCLKRQHEAEEGELQRKMQIHREQGYLQGPGGAAGCQDGAEGKRGRQTQLCGNADMKRKQKGQVHRQVCRCTHHTHAHTHSHTAGEGLFAFILTDTANPNTLTRTHAHAPSTVYTSFGSTCQLTAEGSSFAFSTDSLFLGFETASSTQL